MAGVDVCVQRKATDLWVEVAANVTAAWQRTKDGRTHAFRGIGRNQLSDDCDLFITLKVFARPNALGRHVTSFPEGLEARSGQDDLYYILKSGNLGVFVRLLRDGVLVEVLPWHKSERGNPSILWCGPPICQAGGVQYELVFTLTLMERPGASPGDVRERGSGLPSAGLPSLGKRR